MGQTNGGGVISGVSVRSEIVGQPEVPPDREGDGGAAVVAVVPEEDFLLGDRLTGLRVFGLAFRNTADAADPGGPFVGVDFHADPRVATEVGFAAEDHCGDALGAGRVGAKIRLIPANAAFLEDFREGIFLVGIESLDGPFHQILDFAIGISPVLPAVVHLIDRPFEFRSGDGGGDHPDQIAGGGMMDRSGQFALFRFSRCTNGSAASGSTTASTPYSDFPTGLGMVMVSSKTTAQASASG